MKKILLLLTLVWSFSSCNFLNQKPDDILTQEIVFDSKRKTQDFLANIYSYVSDPIWDYGRNMGFDPLSDDVQIPLVWSSGWWPGTVIQGGWGASMGTYDYWGRTYKAVRASYLFQQNAKAIPEQNLSEEDVAMMKLEARFLVAYFYSQMLELYGPFPLITELIDSDVSPESIMLPRTNMDDIVNWLDQEYLALAEALPVRRREENTEFGRPTRGIVLACRARLWLITASPLFNGNPQYAGMSNPDGSSIFPSSYDPNKWSKAAAAHREFLDLAEGGVYDLYREYYNGDIDPFLSFQNLFLTTADKNPEIIFSRPNCDINQFDKHSQPRGFGGNGGYGITQELVDAFYTRNGLSIQDDPSYIEEGFSSSEGSYATTWSLGNPDEQAGIVTPVGTYNMYVNREPRFYITVRYNDQWLPKERRNTEFYNGGVDGPPSYDAPPCGYLVRKKTHPESRPRDNYTPYRPGIILRLGEMYLNYVEALNESDPNNPDILKYLNLIRERAGIPNIDASLLGQQDLMREAIRHERQIELAVEGKRYMDIRRWLIAESIFRKPTTGMDAQGSKDNFYRRVNFMDRVFNPNMYLWPIYQNYLDNNINLVQNYGW